MPHVAKPERYRELHYGWPYYWGEGATWAWGTGAYPSLLANSQAKPEPVNESAKNDPHLRSAKEVIGYHIHGSDGDIGHIADFIVDDETWTIRYLVIDTSNWWFGKKVLVSPYWTKKVSWAESMVYIDLTMDAIRNSPIWNPESLVNREYEERLYDYYGRPAYWLRANEIESSKAKPFVAQSNL